MHVKVIAEAGVNHNGSMELALKLVDAAKDAGADYIKFQTFKAEKLVSKYAGAADYQKENLKADVNQLEMLKKLSLSYEDFKTLKEYAAKKGIGFISTPFDLDSIEFLKELDMDFYKLPSGAVTNLPYLEAVAKTGKPIVMSTGMSDLEEVREALTVLQDKGAKDITILQCNTEYPTPFEDVNLKAMNTMKEEFCYPVGYSDHTKGIEISLAAVAMGATVIEKHFTLDRTLPGPDHVASLEPDELKQMISSIRNIEKAIGTGIKEPSPSEKKNIAAARASLVAAVDIKAGEVFTRENLTVKRPGTGVNPMRYNEYLGKKANRDYQADTLIEEIEE